MHAIEQYYTTMTVLSTVSVAIAPFQLSEGEKFEACFTLSGSPVGSDFVVSLNSTQGIANSMGCNSNTDR